MENHGLYFSIKDEVLNKTVGLDNVSLPIISELIEITTKFIKGTDSVNFNDVPLAIKEGSLAFSVPQTAVIERAVLDYRKVQMTGNLDGIDPIRARVIASLQEKAKKHPSRIYTISDSSDSPKVGSSIVIKADTNYSYESEETWVQTETYLYGRVFDMGGKKPNVHISLQNGDTMTVNTDVDTLSKDDTNRLYKEQLIRVRAEQNLKTKKLRNESLIGFEKYNPHFDEQEFQNTVEQVKSEWSDVPDIVEWVENIRGNYAY